MRVQSGSYFQSFKAELAKVNNFKISYFSPVSCYRAKNSRLDYESRRIRIRSRRNPSLGYKYANYAAAHLICEAGDQAREYWGVPGQHNITIRGDRGTTGPVGRTVVVLSYYIRSARSGIWLKAATICRTPLVTSISPDTVINNFGKKRREKIKLSTDSFVTLQ